MLLRISILLLSVFFCSCEKEGVLTSNVSETTVSSTSTVLYTGSFVPTAGIFVSGNAKIHLENGQKKVVLENFTISDGPDLKVYLSTTDFPTTFVNLGNLTSATVYNISQQVDLTVYKYVLIHCQQHNHLFAIAALY